MAAKKIVYTKKQKKASRARMTGGGGIMQMPSARLALRRAGVTGKNSGRRSASRGT